MTILILTNNDGGLYHFRKELLEELVKQHKVIIVLPYGEFVDKMVNMGCEFIPCEFNRRGTNPLSDLKQYFNYRRIIKETKPDIVFTYTIKPNVYGGMACASLNVPYVANVTGLGTAVENGGIMQSLTSILYRYGLRKAQKVFFQNVENKDFMLQHGIVRTPWDILPGSGVNLKDFKVTEYPLEKTIDFVFVSRIMKEKGIDQYLEAAKEIRRKHPETRFHICGACEQDYKSQLEKLSKDGVIIYHGSVKDMTVVYQQMCCTVHPTYYPEGLSNVLLESAASARPIITTNRSGCREVVDDGVNGYVVEEKNSQDLIEKIEIFLAIGWEEKKRMGLNGRAKVEKEFDRKIVVNQYIGELKVVQNSAQND